MLKRAVIGVSAPPARLALGEQQMSDEFTRDEGARENFSDPNRIDIDDLDEVLYWSRSLRTTPEEVRLAVATVGPFVEHVCEFIGRT